MNNTSFLQLVDMGKSFPGVRALDQVSVSVNQGEIHGIVGENGAGKSTLIKILAGVYPYSSYEGEIVIDGRECRFHDIHGAETLGVVMIPQELTVVGELSVAENMFLNTWPSSFGRISWDELYRKTSEMIKKLGIHADPQTPIKELSAAQQQLILIGKALSKDVRILILDEPTSSLSETETEVLFDRLGRLKSQGITSLYISHKINEVMDITDRTTILRDGKWVASENTSDLTPKKIVSMMVGRSISEMYPRERHTPGQVMLKIEGLTIWHPEIANTKVVRKVGFEVRAGEIVGLYGLIGAGRTELLHSIFGAWAGTVEGDIYVKGEKASISSPKDAMRYGMGLLTEERKRSGLVEGKSVRVNITLASLDKISRGPVINPGIERNRSERFIKDLNVRTPSIETLVDYLSGGNQQKVIVARWLSAESEILLLDEPTKGIDVGAKVEVFHLLNRLAAEGKAIIFVSSELPEVLGVSDRILVMHEGELRASISYQEATQESIMHYATGHQEV
jgi:D-xylose transport system ATP-binding protein